MKQLSKGTQFHVGDGLCTYGGGVLLLLVQSGTASPLAVAVLLQRVKHLIGQLQVHPQAIAHEDLRSELEGGKQSGYHGNAKLSWEVF